MICLALDGGGFFSFNISNFHSFQVLLGIFINLVLIKINLFALKDLFGLDVNFSLIQSDVFGFIGTFGCVAYGFVSFRGRVSSFCLIGFRFGSFILLKLRFFLVLLLLLIVDLLLDIEIVELGNQIVWTSFLLFSLVIRSWLYPDTRGCI
jgi:hypothetical protein